MFSAPSGYLDSYNLKEAYGNNDSFIYMGVCGFRAGSIAAPDR